MSSAQQLPYPRLVTTAVDANGISTFSSDKEITPFFPFGPKASSFANFHVSTKVPASNTEAAPILENVLPRCPPEGVSFGTTDIPPNYSAPMHRTFSQDYAVILSGEIVLRLDNGDERTVRAGEFILQKGVNHEWINRSSQVCRILFVMVGSEKIVLQNGKALDETVFAKKSG